MTSRLSIRCGSAVVALAALLLGACASGRAAMGDARANSFRMADDPGRGALDVYEGDAPVMSYCYGDRLPEGVPADRRRSSYVHPIYGLDGETLTDDFPADHLHHRGLSLMWPRMKVGEEICQLWHIYGIRTRFRSFSDMLANEAFARFRVNNAWVMDDGREVASENVTYVLTSATATGRRIFVTYEITVGNEPITLQGAESKGYGGLNLRFAPRTDTVVTTDQGEAKDSDRARFAWADLSAKFAGRDEPSGIAILVDPAHPAFPPPWTLRHYGDLNVAWPGVEEVVLEPRSKHVLRYMLWVHRGDAVAGGVEGEWDVFAQTEKAVRALDPPRAGSGS